MREFTKPEIEGLLPVIQDVIKSKEFKVENLWYLMRTIEGSRLFDAKDYLNSSDYKDIAEDYFCDMGPWEKSNFMNEHGFIYESDAGEPYQAENLMEEQVDELLAQLKNKFEYLPDLERVLGARLVAELRGLPDPDPQPDTTNYNTGCHCSKVIDLEPYEIEYCCRMNGRKAHEQWLGNNHEGDFVCMTCTCGKISNPYLKED
jgi:hypothetical protein